jgi:acetylornithine deacetylase/succinyl-diaminopimelate desuccinylase-like protein
MGIASVPTLGFGPGTETQTHGVNDAVATEDLRKAMRFYALFPAALV